MKRVVSLVPSWTESLIEAGACVVGRSRFCIHPADQVKSIEAIGGTKSFDEKKLRALKPDLILLDREENTVAMYDLAVKIAPVLVTHVRSVTDVSRELRAIAEALSPAKSLLEMADRYDLVLSKPALHNTFRGVLRNVKGEITSSSMQTDFVYVIWKDPWMCVSRETFIASVLAQVGWTRLWSPDPATKYPELSELPEDKIILLSSEPYPFGKKTPELPNDVVGIVDGESFSWFGIRTLRFLESAKGSVAT